MLCTSLFSKEHAKSKFLRVLEILQIKYKGIYTWVERTILSLHYSQYHAPLVNHSVFFFQTVLCQGPSSGNRDVLRITAEADDCVLQAGRGEGSPAPLPPSCPVPAPSGVPTFIAASGTEKQNQGLSLFLQLHNNISNRVLFWTEFLSKIWCQGHYV